MRILAIETSCDDTSVSVVDITTRKIKVLTHIVSSQEAIHKEFGGIVPEVAARKHVENLPAILQTVLKKHPAKTIERIAVTMGPGLITSLLVGVEAAKTLAFAWNKPIIPVHHIEGHLLSALIENHTIRFPALGLVVSGGHTELILVHGFGKYRVIGETQDDAAGECFDKAAKILNLGYPGGPAIEKLALKGKTDAYNLPRPMLKSDNYHFSFAGLKTAVLYLHRDGKIPKSAINNFCASLQQAIVDVLVSKTIRAAEKFGVKTVLLGGGVAANSHLKKTLASALSKIHCDFLAPSRKYSTDNATMIAVAAYHNTPVQWEKIKADPNLELK
ncbi:MAG: tRNA (adenosine(37)-N6)-threonylcarbamoyltransferase complex transferase subunit TsaD [bacterium]|nr:tRNA (adenosine(37)-N6)-threonylcarbamoyltransferase complex transferase subunit TsaD [bacterium]